uniref:NADH-ubiquinone oxidoreductase chain 2 n=1 Tax=Engaeus cunicularius TaxID=99757 RepID=W9A1C7_9EUCA|nr:NADH dehydrogenase subunit 2 [Engaeus cunicularius]CDN85540.1 NADH dehydrogenase subunit 2 [Engaeus cunicularius]
MPFSPYKIMFLSLVLTGAIFSISATSWASAWIGLELNLMSFIPLISSKTNLLSSEATLKYFLVQALGSAVIIFSAAVSFMIPNFFLLTISLALFLKMGSAPFHFWFPQIMEGLNWLHSTLLMTIQKLAPMFLVSYLTSDPLCWASISLVAVCSALIGAISGLNQISLRKILAFSSVNHMAWMLFSMLINESTWTLYFLFYSLITSSITILFYFTQALYLSDLMNTQSSLPFKVVSMLSLFSLGGMPPFSGFIPKWIVAQEMIINSYFHTLALLLFCSLITLYFYLRLSTSILSLTPPQNKCMVFWKSETSFLIVLTSFWNLFGIFAVSPMLLL